MSASDDRARNAAHPSEPDDFPPALPGLLAQLHRGRRAQPERFDYQQVSSTTNWNPTPGALHAVRRCPGTPRPRGRPARHHGCRRRNRVALSLPRSPSLAVGLDPGLLALRGRLGQGERGPTRRSGIRSRRCRSLHERVSVRGGEAYPDTPRHRADLDRYHTRPAMRLLRPLVARSTPQ